MSRKQELLNEIEGFYSSAKWRKSLIFLELLSIQELVDQLLYLRSAKRYESIRTPKDVYVPQYDGIDAPLRTLY